MATFLQAIIDDIENAAIDVIEAIERALRRHPHHHRHAPWLIVNGVAVKLIPHGVVHMAVTLSVGHTLTETIAFLDQSGNPMLVTPTPDSPPSWSDTNSAVETLSVSPDGLSFSGPAIAAGTDVVNLTVIVGGVSFSAVENVTVTPAPQVLTSVAIVSAVS